MTSSNSTRSRSFAFQKGQRKDDVAAGISPALFRGSRGVLFLGKAQEKVTVFRTEKRTGPRRQEVPVGSSRGATPVNQFYFYCPRCRLRPLLPEVQHLLPLQRQAVPQRSRVRSSGNWPRKALSSRPWTTASSPAPIPNACSNCVMICRRPKIDALLRKWFGASAASLHRPGPHGWLPLRRVDPASGVLLDPGAGTGRRRAACSSSKSSARNLDLGRPRPGATDLRAARHAGETPGRFFAPAFVNRRGGRPSLHIDYKHTRIKQYHKEGRALRTENDHQQHPRTFAIGKRLHNLPALRAIGFQANRRLLHVQNDQPRFARSAKTLSSGWNGPVVVDGSAGQCLAFR